MRGVARIVFVLGHVGAVYAAHRRTKMRYKFLALLGFIAWLHEHTACSLQRQILLCYWRQVAVQSSQTPAEILTGTD